MVEMVDEVAMFICVETTIIGLCYTCAMNVMFCWNGGNGSKCCSHGSDGEDRYIDVPPGTVAYDAETGKYICDVTEDGQVVMLLKGGRGGLGNWQFRTSTNQAPRYAQPGEPMQEMMVILELKLLADVGLVGFPNAGNQPCCQACLLLALK